MGKAPGRVEWDHLRQLGLHPRICLPTPPIFTAEMVVERQLYAQQLFKYYDLDGLVDILNGPVPASAAWVRTHVCPEEKPLALWAADLD